MCKIKFNHAKKEIEITKAFEKAASRFGSEEYKALRQVREENPNYRVVVIKHKAPSVSFKGLTYEYMDKYVADHDTDGTIKAEYDDLRAKSQEAEDACAESLSYGEIKAWFLKTYPEIAEFHKRRAKIIAAA